MESLPGGLKQYVENARKLLAESKAGVNPLEGWSPAVPDGAWLPYASNEFLEHEKFGLGELDGCCFVLVAGGLGERLGFSGVKFELPSEVSTGDCVLQVYANYILAVQRLATERDPKVLEAVLLTIARVCTAAGASSVRCVVVVSLYSSRESRTRRDRAAGCITDAALTSTASQARSLYST